MIKLLISGLGGSLFPYLHEQLKDQYELFYVDNNVRLQNLYPDYNFIPAPLVTDTNYATFVQSVIQKFNIDYYIPLIDEEIVTAINTVASITGTTVIAPTLNFTELCLNKLQLMHYLNAENISHISSFAGSDFTNQIDFPLFVKPISGRGSRGIKKIHSLEQLEAYYLLEEYAKENVLIQPLVEGTEYTVGVLTNNLNNLISISSKRIVAKKGITQIAVTENNELIDRVVLQIVEKMKPCGPINIQLMITPDFEVKIFEINPRFSTTTIMEYEGCVDLISNFIQNYNKEYLAEPIRPKVNLTLHRRWENVFYNA
jgi:carbamoyl-phosphate synthase large subunit